MSSGFYDEDGIDGPWEKAMSKPLSRQERKRDNDDFLFEQILREQGMTKPSFKYLAATLRRHCIDCYRILWRISVEYADRKPKTWVGCLKCERVAAERILGSAATTLPEAP